MEQDYSIEIKLNKPQKVASVPFFRKWYKMERMEH